MDTRGEEMNDGRYADGNHELGGRDPVQLNERVGTAERTTALELLSRAVAGGYLDITEYDQRIVAVHGARTVGDIVTQLRDLPQDFHWHPGREPVPVPVPVPVQPAPASGNPHTLAVLALTFGIASIPLGLCVGVGAVPGIAAVLLARRVWRERREQGLAVTGAVLGLIGVAFSAVVLVALIVGDPGHSTP
jgi:hypothetical protein